MSGHPEMRHWGAIAGDDGDDCIATVKTAKGLSIAPFALPARIIGEQFSQFIELRIRTQIIATTSATIRTTPGLSGASSNRRLRRISSPE